MFEDEDAAIESRKRVEQQTPTPFDQLMATRSKVAWTYGLHRVSMVQPMRDPRLLSAFFDQHKDPTCLRQFRHFWLCHVSLRSVHQQWMLETKLSTQTHPLQLADRGSFEIVRMLKGLLWVAGLTSPTPSQIMGPQPSEPVRLPSSPAAEGEVSSVDSESAGPHRVYEEETGSVTSQAVIDTTSVTLRLQHPPHRQWLADNQPWIRSNFGCSLRTSTGAPVATAAFIRCLRKALSLTVGLALMQATLGRSRVNGCRTKVTFWRIDPAQQHDKLELAAAAAVNTGTQARRCKWGDWNVTR